MADHRLKPLTPLGHDAPETVTIGPVTITEVVGMALASLAIRRGRDADVAHTANTARIPLPLPGCWTDGQPYAGWWLGPDQWMIEAPFASHADIRNHLVTLFGDAASITEQTDGWVRFDVAGTDLPSLFERLCNVDLRGAKTGAATRCVIDHLGVYVVVRAADFVSVFGPRSSARSLHHALTTAARSAY